MNTEPKPILVISFGKYKTARVDLIEFLATTYNLSKSEIKRRLKQNAKLSMGVLYESS